MCFDKVINIKIVKNVVMNRFGRVAAYLSSPYWCVYSAECRVQSETVCTVHNAECRVRLCVQCTVQSETVCTVHSAE